MDRIFFFFFFSVLKNSKKQTLEISPPRKKAKMAAQSQGQGRGLN
jgi:hypothetical protein